jgi:hypothetical protein
MVDKILGSLLMSYLMITKEEVACSNELYHHWAISDKYENNCWLSMDLLHHQRKWKPIGRKYQKL